MDDLEKRSSSDLQSESWSTTTVYDTVYERDNSDEEAVNVAQGDTAEGDENAVEEEVYEEYNGDHQEYTPRYASYAYKSESISQKFIKKKQLAILVLLVVCTVGVVVGLSIHFARVSPTTTLTSITTMSITTTVSPNRTTSVIGTLFSFKWNKLNFHLSLLFISA